MTILGLMGPKRSGKSTVARYLRDEYGFHVVEPGFQVMQLLLKVNPIMGCADEFRVSDIYERYGYEGFKNYHEGRRLLQELGTQIRGVDPDFWVKQQNAEIHNAVVEGKNVVHAAVRFPNEAKAIWAWGGDVILVDRGLSSDDPHESERAMKTITPDYTLTNTGPVESLLSDVSALLHRMG